MKYYDESVMKEIRQSFEAEILGWPGVTTKKMFGCPCYLVDKSMFALLVTGGVVLTRLADKEKDELAGKFTTQPFQAGQRQIKNWLKANLKSKPDIKRILRFVQMSYGASAAPKI